MFRRVGGDATPTTLARRVPLAEHLVDGLLRGDTEARFNAYRSAILAGWMSRNEVREREYLNPKPGLDTFLEPLNTGTVGELDIEAK